MDKTIFEVEISNSGPKSYETATVMKMPASFAEFSDALQKARIKDGSFCKNELTCIHYNGLTHAMIGWNANLYDLNLFAQRLASLTEEQKKGMDALLKIKQNHRVAPIPLNQLINLTYNTDICCFAPRVSNHEELGAFLYANEMLSNEAMALLDTTEEGSGFRERLLELLGEQHQEDHGGVFTDFGYAEMMFREKYSALPEELFQTPQAAQIGQKMLDDRLGVITEYGLIRRKDGQPLPVFQPEQEIGQGLEMM